MFQRGLHIFLILSLITLVGCKAAEGETDDKAAVGAVLYDNPEQGVRVLETEGWVIEKETESSVKFKNEKIVAIISVLPKGETVAEIKQQLVSSAGKITVTGEGPNLISWKSDRDESIHTNVYIDEKEDRNVVTTFLTPFNEYENNSTKIEEFQWNIELY